MFLIVARRFDQWWVLIMKTLFSVFYYWITTYGDPDNATASVRASIFLALCQTFNTFSILFLLTMMGIVRWNYQIDNTYLVVTEVIFITMNLLLIKKKNVVSKNEKVFTLIYFLLSLIIFGVLMNLTEVIH